MVLTGRWIKTYKSPALELRIMNSSVPFPVIYLLWCSTGTQHIKKTGSIHVRREFWNWFFLFFSDSLSEHEDLLVITCKHLFPYNHWWRCFGAFSFLTSKHSNTQIVNKPLQTCSLWTFPQSGRLLSNAWFGSTLSINHYLTSQST